MKKALLALVLAFVMSSVAEAQWSFHFSGWYSGSHGSAWFSGYRAPVRPVHYAGWYPYITVVRPSPIYYPRWRRYVVPTVPIRPMVIQSTAHPIDYVRSTHRLVSKEDLETERATPSSERDQTIRVILETMELHLDMIKNLKVRMEALEKKCSKGSATHSLCS